jgi:hypothetical protein
MMRRRGLMFVVMAGCWIVLLAFVLTSVLQATKLAKHHRGKDRQALRRGDRRTALHALTRGKSVDFTGYWQRHIAD